MSKIERMIEELCPNGVEYVRIDDVCDINRGRVMSKGYLRDNSGNYPVYSSQTANNGIFGYIDSYDYDFESITWTTDGANAGSVFYHINENFSITNVCGLLKVNTHTVNTKFLFYILEVIAKSYVSPGMGNPKLMSTAMSRIIIPLPPLPVQEEIVRILDKFTLLEAELEAELEARQKQYEYYRDELLEFGDGVPMVALREVAKISNGKDHKHLSDGEIPVYGSGGIMRYASKYIYNNKSVLIPRKGSLSSLFYLETPFWTVDTIFYTKIDEEKVIPKYFFYYLQTQRLENLNEAAGVPSLTQTVLNRVSIPLLPLAEQARIVAILDRFDALVNDISVGLPAEIEARRKQYEYYRDKLLTFKEREV